LELKKGEREALLAALTCYALPVSGHEGYAKAEVTGGGVPLNEVDCSTLESRLAPGLHLCGEVLDVFGRIGGFNFYWAWATGRVAGAVAALLRPSRAAGGAAVQQGA
jgi:predicted flavoprotein YhiN